MITMEVADHGGNEAKSGRVTVMGLWAAHVSISPPPSLCPSESNAVIVPTSEHKHSINHRNRHFHRQPRHSCRKAPFVHFFKQQQF